MSDRTEILSAKDLCKSYGKGASRTEILHGLDLHVLTGEFLAIMGPSGCGKSTLLHTLGLMTSQDSGTIVVDGKTVPDTDSARTAIRRKDIGFVFQRFNLLSVLSARDNVNISMKVRGLNQPERTKELFSELGISNVADRNPGQMSIGEQQRVAVSRALAHKPRIVFADEPTGNLDSANTEALLDCFCRINRQHGQTIVMITHDADVATRADRTLHMADGKLNGEACQ